jgi:hypothetical protein
MSFQDLFKRQVGGTKLGNIIRDIANKESGGVIGNGAMMISVKEYDLKNLSESDYIAKYAKTKTGVPVAGVNPNLEIASVEMQIKDSANNVNKDLILVNVKKWFTTNWKMILLVLVVPFGLFIVFAKAIKKLFK